jgi:hypothetical protein
MKLFLGKNQLLATLLFVPSFILCIYLTTHQSLHIDESAHIAAGLYTWQTGDFSPYSVNPPLPRMLATLPAYLFAETNENEVRIASARSEFEYARIFCAKNTHQSFSVISARLVNLLWFCLIVVYMHKCSSHISCCISSIVLTCYDPTMLSFASMLTPDISFAACTLVLAYYLFHFLNFYSERNAIKLGVALGLSLSTKHTALLFVFFTIFLMVAFRNRDQCNRKQLVYFLFILLSIAYVLLLTTYFFSNIFMPLGDFEFRSQSLGATRLPNDGGVVAGNIFRDSIVGRIPLPFPADWLLGIDLQKSDFESGMLSYLDGEWSRSGWLRYYVSAMFYKLTLPSLLLLSVSLILSLYRIARYDDKFYIVVVALPFLIISFVSANVGINHHMRYVLAAFPLLFLAVSTLDSASVKSWILQCFVKSILLLHVFTCFACLPFTLSYFNQLAGSSQNGWRHLVDSNIDWGQDFHRFEKWLHSRPEIQQIGVRLFSIHSSRTISDKVIRVPQEPTPGLYAVSVNFVAGHNFHINKGLVGPYAYFQKFQPVDRIGYSIHIYHITLEEANRVRAEMGLPLLPEPAPDGQPPGEPPPKDSP